MSLSATSRLRARRVGSEDAAAHGWAYANKKGSALVSDNRNMDGTPALAACADPGYTQGLRTLLEALQTLRDADAVLWKTEATKTPERAPRA